jgi:hypothetical protein
MRKTRRPREEDEKVTSNSKGIAVRVLQMLAVALAVISLTLAPGVAEARAKESKRYGIEGKFLGYDEARQVFRILVTSREAKGFGGSTVGGKAPKDIEPGKERDFAVKPEGSVLSRTVIKSVEGTGLDNTGTQDGFRKAVSAIPTDRALALSVEKNADHETKPDAPEYRIKTLVVKMTEEEIQRRLDELLEDD